jgi:hypothetical protein
MDIQEGRYLQIIKNINNQEYYDAMTLLLTLIDRSAKHTYGNKLGVGKRFKKLITENQKFITWFISGFLMYNPMEILTNGKTLSELLYDVRNSLIHDAETNILDFIRADFIAKIDGNRISFNPILIFALFTMLCYLPINKNIIPKGIKINLNTKIIEIDKILGVGIEKAIKEIESM